MRMRFTTHWLGHRRHPARRPGHRSDSISNVIKFRSLGRMVTSTSSLAHATRVGRKRQLSCSAIYRLVHLKPKGLWALESKELISIPLEANSSLHQTDLLAPVVWERQFKTQVIIDRTAWGTTCSRRRRGRNIRTPCLALIIVTGLSVCSSKPVECTIYLSIALLAGQSLCVPSLFPYFPYSFTRPTRYYHLDDTTPIF